MSGDFNGITYCTVHMQYHGGRCLRCEDDRLKQATTWPLPPAGHPDPVEMTEPPSALDHQEGGGHYKAMKIQPIEFIHANGIPFAEGCVIKYVSRWRSKNGLADLKKARHFLDLLIELEENK
jgi:hypothetical protein